MRYPYAPIVAALALAGVSPAVSDTLELSSGETLTGQVVEQTDAEVVFEHPILGRLSVASDQVARLTIEQPAQPEPEPEPQPEPAAPPQPSEDDRPREEIDPEPEVPGFLEGWDSSLSLGFSGSQGNSENTSFNTQFRTRKENDAHRWLLDAGYFFAKDGQNRTENEFNAELTKDWLLPDSPWFYFVRTGFEYDEFEDWETRASGFAGVGYEFVKQEDFELLGRLGAGGTKEFSGEKDFTPEALLGAAVSKWHITPNQELIAEATLYPAMDELGEFRLTSKAEWKIAIDHADGLSLKLGVQNEYESEVAPGSKHNDFKYYGAITYDF